MKASFHWLKSLVDGLAATPRELADRLTAAGLEVEAIIPFGKGAETCVVVSVLRMRPHPKKSGLRLVTVDRGGSELEVICGAPNVPEPGGLVVLAPLGAHLPAKGMTIERREIAGVVSEGMLCSEAELGLGEDSGGILILPAGSAAPGTPFVKAFPFAEDSIFEIGLTPNRPDCLGHLGLAREIAALYKIPTKRPSAPSTASSPGSAADHVAITIADGERCPHYGGAVVQGICVGPSPLWVRWRLASLGVRSLSNVVDITNLVMLETGHPMHGFDLDRVRGKAIDVRRAREGERLVTLDGVERTLTGDDLVICDAEGPVALAGVMGGGNSEIQSDTKRVLFECAYFQPRGIRRASRRHALHTESSHRFERGVDPTDVDYVLARACALTLELAGGTEVKEFTHVVKTPHVPAKVKLRSARLDALLGVPVPFDDAIDVLTRLGFGKHASSRDAAEFEVPGHRPDVSREVDLIEEIARVRGMDQLPAVLPSVKPTADAAPKEAWTRSIRAAAASMGLSEAVTYGFCSPKALEILGAPAPAVVLKNPLSELTSVMRTSLLPGLLDALSLSLRHNERDVRMFTVGALFLPGRDRLPHEALAFAAILSGERPAYLHRPDPVDVWDAAGLATELVWRVAGRKATVELEAEASRPAHLHPRGAARIVADGRVIGRLGPLHPAVTEALDLDAAPIVVELDLETLIEAGRVTPQYQPIPRFPAATRDVALVVPVATPARDVERVVREAAGALAEDVRLFDRFTGGNLPKDRVSLAFRVVYRAADRTLTDTEVEAAHQNVVSRTHAAFGATLRS